MNFDASFQLTGRDVCRLMRQHRCTIRTLANRVQTAQKRVRYVRANGISGHAACDWYEHITGALSPRMRACYVRYAQQ